jgi:Flp pilus assembly protein TadG
MSAPRALGHHHRRGARPPARRGERGTQLVEVALTLPIFLLVLFGFVDLGLGVFQSSQATSAAADGARAGMVSFRTADVTGGADRAAIEAAVRARLPGQHVDEISVRCITPADATVACADADADVDRIRVKVSWQYAPISPLGRLVPAQTLTGSATMGLVDQPLVPVATSTPSTTTTTTAPTTTTTAPSGTTTTTAPPNTCTVTSMTSSPSTVTRKNNGSLYIGFGVSVITNGASGCAGLTVQVVTNGSSTATITLTKGSSTSWTAFVSKQTYSWTTGAKTGTVYAGTTAVGTGTLVTVQ